jgi:hypothetical protein
MGLFKVVFAPQLSSQPGFIMFHEYTSGNDKFSFGNFIWRDITEPKDGELELVLI